MFHHHSTQDAIISALFLFFSWQDSARAQTERAFAPPNSDNSVGEISKNEKNESVAPFGAQPRGSDADGDFWNSTQSPELPTELNLIPSQDGWIYGSKEARNLVLQARAFDPQFCPIDHSNRSKAIEFYEAAMEAQPGVPTNAAIADRIAQLLAFAANPVTGLRPDPQKAAHWWEKCRSLTDSSQLLWAQSLMGSASTQVMEDSLQSSVDTYKQILKIDPESLRLNDWQLTSRLNNPAWEKIELQRLKRELALMQADARKNILYVEKAMSARLAIQESIGSIPVPSRRWFPIMIFNITAISLGVLGYVSYRRRKVR